MSDDKAPLDLDRISELAKSGQGVLSNGSVYDHADIANIARRLKEHVFDKKGFEQASRLSELERAVEYPNHPDGGPEAPFLKAAGLLGEDGKVKPIVADIMKSMKTPEGGYVM